MAQTTMSTSPKLIELIGGFEGGKYVLPKLPYSPNALEPIYDTETVQIHYSKHHAAYVANVNAALDKNDFLKILITQLTHQDPTQPMNDKEFVAQMAQFSSLEQITNMSNGLTKVADLLSRSQAVSGISTAKASMYAVTTHSISVILEAKSAMILGMETLTIEESRVAMIMPIMTITITIHLYLGYGAVGRCETVI